MEKLLRGEFGCTCDMGYTRAMVFIFCAHQTALASSGKLTYDGDRLRARIIATSAAGSHGRRPDDISTGTGV